MKKTSKILFIILSIILTITVILGVSNHTVYAADDEYDMDFDLNNVETDDDSTNATNKTNTTTNGSENNTVIVNKNNTANAANNTNSNNATNKSNSANQATTNHPQTGEFMNGKVIAGVSIATFALIIAFAKLKKYNY